jgi:hypothetical protein
LVTEILGVFTDIFSGLVSAMTTLVTDAFSGLIYNSTDGLSDIAIWSLVFGAIAVVLGLVNRFTRA